MYRFFDGVANTPESNISGFGWAVNEQARPVFMGFSHIGLMYHFLICQLTYLRAIKLSDVYSLRQQSRETCHRKNWLKYYHEYM